MNEDPEVFSKANPKNIEVIVHTVRLLVKIGMVLTLYYGMSTYAFPLSVYIIISEIIDQINILVVRSKPELKKLVTVFYIINSVTLISFVAYFASWQLNDFYLVYLVHISSSAVGFGVYAGLLSFILSMFSYSALLFLVAAPLPFYLRLPLMAVISLRVLTSQLNYQKTKEILNNLVNIEKSKQDFIALASHNLRTPVAAIYGYIEILLRGDSGRLNDQQTDFLKKIKGNNQELEKLTEQLLQISIFEINKQIQLQKQPSQIEVIIEDVIEKLEPVAKSKNLYLNFKKINGLLPLTNLDVEKIKIVLSNLVDNALKYTEKGGVVITAERENGFVVIKVTDTGIGIPKSDLPKMFNKFFRSGNVLVYNKSGTGLGLYISKQIINLHGGKLEVESEEAKGTTFTFSLPVIEEEN